MTDMNTVKRKICPAISYNIVTNWFHLHELLDQYNFAFTHGKIRKHAKEYYDQLLTSQRLCTNVIESILSSHILKIQEMIQTNFQSYRCMMSGILSHHVPKYLHMPLIMYNLIW